MTQVNVVTQVNDVIPWILVQLCYHVCSQVFSLDLTKCPLQLIGTNLLYQNHITPQNTQPNVAIKCTRRRRLRVRDTFDHQKVAKSCFLQRSAAWSHF